MALPFLPNVDWRPPLWHSCLPNLSGSAAGLCLGFVYPGFFALLGWVNGVQFLIEEIALFGVLVLVKHRLPSVFEPFLRRR
jgi:hypothetical protein